MESTKTLILFTANGNYRNSAGEPCHVLEISEGAKVATKEAIVLERPKPDVLKEYGLEPNNNQ